MPALLDFCSVWAPVSPRTAVTPAGAQAVEGATLLVGDRTYSNTSTHHEAVHYFFNSTPGEHLLTLRLEQSKRSSDRGCTNTLTFSDAYQRELITGGGSITSLDVGESRSIDTRRYAIRAEPGQYLVDIETVSPSRRPCPYTFRVGPASALTAQLPPGPTPTFKVSNACLKAATQRPRRATIRLTDGNRTAITEAEFAPMPADCPVIRRMVASGSVWLQSYEERPNGPFGPYVFYAGTPEDLLVPVQGGVVTHRASVLRAHLKRGGRVKRSEQRTRLTVAVHALTADTPAAYRLSQGYGYELRGRGHAFPGLPRNPYC